MGEWKKIPSWEVHRKMKKSLGGIRWSIASDATSDAMALKGKDFQFQLLNKKILKISKKLKLKVKNVL